MTQKLKNLNFNILKTKNIFSLAIIAMFTIFSLSAFTKAIIGDFNLYQTIPAQSNFFTTDFLKSAYIINQKNQVEKYDSTGRLINRFSENKYGKVSFVDATSPFNVLLFFKDNATIVTTDFKLSPKRLYRLSSIDINNVSAACLANDNYIWIYDMDASRLKKVNPDYEVLLQGTDMVQLLGQEITPNFLIERDGFVYMNVPGLGIIIFDVFGTFYTTISSTDLENDNLQHFQVIDQKVVFYKESSLFVYDVYQKELNTIPIPKTGNIKDVKVEKGLLYLLNDDELRYYTQVN